MKKIYRIFIIITAIALVIFICIGILLPVDFDVRNFSDEFKTYISNKYAGKLGLMFFNKQDKNKLESYNVNNYIPKVTELSENMVWKGRKIYTSANIEFDNSVYKVDYEGKKYWFKEYYWRIVNIIEIK